MHIWRQMPFPACCGRRKAQQKVTERWCKGSVATLKESFQLGRVSQDSYPRNSFLREPGKLGSRHAVKFSKGTWRQIKILERKVLREELSKSVRFMSVVFARQKSGKEHMRRPCTKKDAPAEQHGIWRKYLQAQEDGHSYVLYSYWSEGNAGTHFKKIRGTRIRSRFRSVIAHDEQKKDLRLDELDTLPRSRKLTVVLTTNGEALTHEEAQVSVHDLHLFVTVQLLEETPAVLSLGKLCEDHGYPREAGQRSKKHGWPKKGRQSDAKRTVSYLLSSRDYPPILEAFRLLHRHRRTHRVHLQVQYWSEVTE